MVQKIQGFELPHLPTNIISNSALPTSFPSVSQGYSPPWLDHSHTNRCTQANVIPIHFSAREFSPVMTPWQSYSCQGPVYAFQRTAWKATYLVLPDVFPPSTMSTCLISYKFSLEIYNRTGGIMLFYYNQRWTQECVYNMFVTGLFIIFKTGTNNQLSK